MANKAEFPEALFERLRASNVVLCAGVRFASLAGAPAGLPDWDKLLRDLSAKAGAEGEAVVELIDRGAYLTAAGFLRRKLGDESLAEHLQQAFGGERELPPSYQALSELPFVAAISTGYDRLLEQTVGSGGREPRIYSYRDGSVLRLSDDLRDYVIRAHGDVSDPEGVVFSTRDLKRLIAPNQAYRAFVENLYRTHTLLLVGYRPTDPDFVLFMERLVGSFRDGVTDHYAILSGLSGPEQEELYANYRLRVIPYEAGDDESAVLTDVVRSFRDQWKKAGGAVADVEHPQQWLKNQLGAVELRIDVVAGEGLSLSEGRLRRIHDTAAHADLNQLDPSTLCRLGNVRLYVGDIAGAIECYNAALEQQPDLAEAHLNLHHARAEAREYGPALEHLQKASELDESLRVVPKQYDLQAVIGRGTSGTVYHAVDTETKRDVVVKVLRTSYVQEHVSPELWLKETEKVKKLDHPHVARILDTVIEGGRCIIVGECLEGRSLERALRDDGVLAPERAAEIMGQVCEALVYAHEQGALHLDVAPSNIFLRDKGGVALMDFRSGRAQKGRHVTIKRGHEGFQAPELLAGAGADERADVYSLGATLYFALTRQAPIGSFARLSEVNPAARRYDRLINRALRAVPDERPQSVAEFAKELEGSTGAVAVPERDDDLAGWLEVLAYQPDHERASEVIDKLENDYRQQSQWDDLVTLLLGRVEVETEPERRLSMLREVARVFELEVGDIGKAFAALQAAFREDSASIEIQRDLERLAAATGMWNELLAEYTTVAQNQREPKVAGDWWVRIGKLYSHELGHDDYAAAAFNHALSLDANRVEALTELAEVLRRKGDSKELARALSRQASLEDESARKVELLDELAQLYQKQLESAERAVATYRQLLEIEPSHRRAIDTLAAYYEKLEMWQELADLLRQAVSAADVVEDQIRLRHQLAETLSERLSQRDAAIEQLNEVLALSPDDAPALRTLERLYDAAGRNEAYLEILNRRIDAANNDDEKVALYRRLAEEWEGQPGGRKRAAEYLEQIHLLGKASEDTYRSLVRIYWELKDYSKLVESYENHIAIAERPEDKAVLYAALGRLYEDHIKDLERAIDAFDNMLQADEKNKIAVAALARLYEQTGEWERAAERLEQLAELTDEPAGKAEAYQRLGKVQWKHLQQSEEAEASLMKAREVAPQHVDTLRTLADLYHQRKDYAKAARMLHEAARHTANDLDRARRLHRTASIHLDDLRDDSTGIEVLRELLDVDPEHVEGGERLALLYEQRGQQEEARPLLRMLVRKTDPKDREHLLELNLRLARAAAECDDRDEAISAYRAAYDLEPTSREALRGLADLLRQADENEEAAKHYQSLLVHQRDSLPTEELVDVFFRLGEIKEALGEHDKALNMVQKAIDVDPDNAEALRRAIAIYETRGDYDKALGCKRSLLKSVEGDEERVQLIEEMGDIALQKLERPRDAARLFEDALQIQPSLRRVLYKKMETHVALKEWEQAIGVLKRMEEHEADPAHSYRLHYTAAVILRDELSRPEEAAGHFDLALQANPTNRQAFEDLRQLYLEQKKYKKLIRAYRLMLKRLPEETSTQERVRLWGELGELAQNKAHDAREAIIAYEMVAKLDPAANQHQEQLVRLYATAGPDAYDKAVLANQRLLRNDPMRLDAYQELYRIYASREQFDKVYCVSSILAVLKQASPEQIALYERHRPPELRRAKSKLTDEGFKQLYHPDQVGVLNEIFGTVAPLFAPMAIKPRSDYRFKSSEQLQPQEDSRPYARIFNYVCELLAQSPHEVYLKQGMKRPTTVLIIADGDDQLQVMQMAPNLLDAPERDVAFHFARALALLRPEHALCSISPSLNVLRAVTLACLKVLDRTTKLAGDTEVIMRLADAFADGLSTARIDELASHVDELRAASDEAALAGWLRGAELTFDRAGLLVCDDLEVAAKWASNVAPMAVKELSAKQRVAQLFAFAASEPYFELRDRLGLAVAPLE